MKFSTIALALTSALSYVSTVAAADTPVADDAAQKPLLSPKGDFEPTKEKPYNFRIEYLLTGKQETPSAEVVPVTNGEKISLTYEFQNNEDEEVSIIGVGGKLIDPASGETRANITANQLGPLKVADNQTVSFIQNVGVDVQPDTYLLVPSVYVVYNQKFMVLGGRNQLITVADPVISVFNPQLIIAVVLLLGALGGIGYAVYATVGEKYLKGVVMANKAKKTANGASDVADTASKTTSADFNKEWLPESHLKTSGKRKD